MRGRLGAHTVAAADAQPYSVAAPSASAGSALQQAGSGPLLQQAQQPKAPISFSLGKVRRLRHPAHDQAELCIAGACLRLWLPSEIVPAHRPCCQPGMLLASAGANRPEAGRLCGCQYGR